MITGLKNFSFILIFNLSLFLMLMVGIQNSSQKSEVNFLNNETIDLPISFIIGINFLDEKTTTLMPAFKPNNVKNNNIVLIKKSVSS